MSSRCDNCGAPGWEEKEGFACRSCGFKKIANNKLPTAEIIFCEDCGCHYLDLCERGHPLDHQKKVELPKKP